MGSGNCLLSCLMQRRSSCQSQRSFLFCQVHIWNAPLKAKGDCPSFSSLTLSLSTWDMVPFSVAFLGGRTRVILGNMHHVTWNGPELAASRGWAQSVGSAKAQCRGGCMSGKESEEGGAPQIETRHEPGLVRDEELQWACLAQQEGSKKKL